MTRKSDSVLENCREVRSESSNIRKISEKRHTRKLPARCHPKDRKINREGATQKS